MYPYNTESSMSYKGDITVFKEKRLYAIDPFDLMRMYVLDQDEPSSKEVICLYSKGKKLPTRVKIKARYFVPGVPEVKIDFWDLKNKQKVDLIQVVRRNSKGWCNYREFEECQQYMMTFYKGDEFAKTQNPENLEIKSQGEYGIVIPNVHKRGYIIESSSNEDIKELFGLAETIYSGITFAIKKDTPLYEKIEKATTDILFKSP